MRRIQLLVLGVFLFAFVFEFNADAAPEFRLAYKDKVGLTWSQSLGDSFLDECNAGYPRNPCDKDIEFLGSISGTKGCELVEARLPTKAEYERLLMEFDHTVTSYGPRLTETGLEKMRQLFSNGLYGEFLTSQRGTDFTYVLNGFGGFMGLEYWISSTYHFSAICVR
jgi:hypothetical protein